MGFSHDPGPLPFVTVRDGDKWGPRLTNGWIEIVGEHGFAMPLQMCHVAKVEPHTDACPPELASVYQGKRLIRVHLEAEWAHHEKTRRRAMRRQLADVGMIPESCVENGTHDDLDEMVGVGDSHG